MHLNLDMVLGGGGDLPVSGEDAYVCWWWPSTGSSFTAPASGDEFRSRTERYAPISPAPEQLLPLLILLLAPAPTPYNSMG